MLTERLDFTPDRAEEAFASAPAAPAVFLLRGDDPQAEPYVSKTANLRRRLLRLLGPPDQSRRLNLRDRVRSIEYTATGSDFESGFLLYRALRTAFPKTYSDRLRLRFAPLSSCTWKMNIRAPPSPPGWAVRADILLLRPLPFPRRGRKVCQRFTRLLQDAPLRGRPPSRSTISRLHLFRNENVPRPMLQRLYRRGLPG